MSHRRAVGLHGGRFDQPLALVLLEDAAMAAREALELRGIETAAGHHQAVRVRHAGVRRRHRRDDVIDVALDVDPGFILEFPLPLFLRQHQLEALAQLGIHDFADVGEGHDAGVRRDITQLRRTGTGG
jgi:hypothetical protein